MLARSLGYYSINAFFAVLVISLSAVVTLAEPTNFDPLENDFFPNGVHVLDGSYVLNMGELHINITNHGLIGSQYSAIAPYSDAPSGQWPGGSGNEYLWGAGLWVGGRIGGEVMVSTGQYEREFRPGPDLVDTIYEAKEGKVIRPVPNEHTTGLRWPSSFSNDDNDLTYDEDFLNGLDDDHDGLVDEDFAQIGDQMFTCTMYDNLSIISEIYPQHRPMNLKVVQRAFSWGDENLENVIGLEFEITNIGFDTIEDVYLGFFVDCDIQQRTDGPNIPDDLAGFYSGSVRADDGKFYRADIAYMMDGSSSNPLPGCLGVMLIDHTTEFIGNVAPFHAAINSFQVFSTNASVYQEGEPISDADRYYTMSRNRIDRNTHPDNANDLKFLISSGPFSILEPGKTLKYKLAFIIGDGLDGMLQTAVEAGKVGAGRWFDRDNNIWTGRSGRETKVALGDYPPWPNGTDPIMGHRINFMNEECAGSDPVIFQDVVWEENLIPGSGGEFYIWVNMDNCEECFRARGYDCTPANFLSTNMSRTRTGIYGRETHYPWTIIHETPPPPPQFRIVPGDRCVEVFWNDISEHAVDPDNGMNDFESYEIWRAGYWTRPPGTPAATSPPTELWGQITKFDVVNFIIPMASNSQIVQPLGLNTGLQNAIYIPECFGNPLFAGMAEEMQLIVDSDIHGRWLSRPPLRGIDGSVIPGMEGLVRWESYETVLDTFFMATERVADSGIVPKRAENFYHFMDTNLPNGFDTYYAVTASDHAMVYTHGNYLPSGYGIFERPSNHFQLTTPRPDAQTLERRQNEGLNIYVFPNPATNKSLEEYLAQAPSSNNPTGVHITWNNLPLAQNTISIFTASGDLVNTVHHDGFVDGGSASWNLMSRNGQEVTNGIYLYVVQSDNGAFADVPGKFVIVR